LGPPDDQEVARAADPSAAVFVPDRVAREGGVPAPPGANRGTHAVVTDLDGAHPFAPLLHRYVELWKPSAVVRTAPSAFAAAEAELRRELPEFVTIVTAPDRLDVNV